MLVEVVVMGWGGVVREFRKRVSVGPREVDSAVCQCCDLNADILAGFHSPIDIHISKYIVRVVFCLHKLSLAS